jgi:hypothetical protein
MPVRVEKSGYDPDGGFQYYVTFQPDVEEEDVARSFPVEAALSVSETGDIADVAFTLPKLCRNEDALFFIRREKSADYIEPRVFIVLPDQSGDALVSARGKLDLDAAGRIVGMEIHWRPEETGPASN